MKILNLYAGIGGNRKLWGNEHKIVAVEIDKEIAQIYHDFYPDDEVIITDAHQFLLENFKKFDFIWSSPPCPSHSRLRMLWDEKIYPDMDLYQEIILLNSFSKNNKWVIENVIPYYDYLIKPQVIIDRHVFWSNFYIEQKDFQLRRKDYPEMSINDLEKYYGISLQKYRLPHDKKRRLLRNCVHPSIGKHIFDCIFRKYLRLDNI